MSGDGKEKPEWPGDTADDVALLVTEIWNDVWDEVENPPKDRDKEAARMGGLAIDAYAAKKILAARDALKEAFEIRVSLACARVEAEYGYGSDVVKLVHREFCTPDPLKADDLDAMLKTHLVRLK